MNKLFQFLSIFIDLSFHIISKIYLVTIYKMALSNTQYKLEVSFKRVSKITTLKGGCYVSRTKRETRNSCQVN